MSLFKTQPPDVGRIRSRRELVTLSEMIFLMPCVLGIHNRRLFSCLCRRETADGDYCCEKYAQANFQILHRSSWNCTSMKRNRPQGTRTRATFPLSTVKRSLVRMSVTATGVTVWNVMTAVLSPGLM